MIYRLGYINIVFAFLYQIFLFQDIPTHIQLIGIIFVVIASVLSILEESWKQYSIKKKNEYHRVSVTDSGDSAIEIADEVIQI